MKQEKKLHCKSKALLCSKKYYDIFTHIYKIRAKYYVSIFHVVVTNCSDVRKQKTISWKHRTKVCELNFVNHHWLTVLVFSLKRFICLQCIPTILSLTRRFISSGSVGLCQLRDFLLEDILYHWFYVRCVAPILYKHLLFQLTGVNLQSNNCTRCRLYGMGTASLLCRMRLVST